MNKKTLFKRAVSGALVLVTAISTAYTPNMVHAAELDTMEYPTYEMVKEQLSQEEVVKANDYEIAIGSEFDVESNYTGLEIPDANKVSVKFMEAKNEAGEVFSVEQENVFKSVYLVEPKSESPAYLISRNLIVKGMEIPNVEVETVERSKKQAKSVKEEVERGLESGEKFVLTPNLSMAETRSGTVTVNVGEVLRYPSYLGNYSTNYFDVNGKTAYCLESHKGTPVSGDYVASVLDSNKNLQKVLYYGYGGSGDITESYWAGYDWKTRYIFTHIAASYAYAGTAGFAGCSYENLVKAGVIAYIDHLFAMEVPPKGDLSFSSASVSSKRDGNVQKTSDITLNGDHRNFISLKLPTGVVCVNKTKNTTTENGTAKIYGGDTFYLQAPLSMYGEFATGKLYGNIRETWRTLVVGTGGVSQDVGVFESFLAESVSFTIKWLSMSRIKLQKKDSETKNGLAGAVYGIYRDEQCTSLMLEMQSVDNDGVMMSDYFDSSVNTVYVKEITAPIGYMKNDTVYTVKVSAGKTVQIEADDGRSKGKLTVVKIDRETGAFLSQGDATLEGAVYGLYAKEDIVHPDGHTGVLYTAGSLIEQKTFGKSGKITFENLDFGKYYVKEIKAPEGYLLDPTEYPVSVTMLVMMESIQQRIVENGQKGKATWLYVDEFHVLLNSEYSAKYLQQLWKKVRKQGGLCTGITQNVVDLLQNYTATTMLANSEFVALLKQANTDSSKMAEVIGVSEAQLRFVTNTSSGMGLLKCGAVVIPFDNTISKDTDLYKLYNTNIHEKIAEEGAKIGSES